MNNLTSTILTNHSNIQAEEWLKQGQAIEFNSGKSQRIINSSIPALEITLTYKNLTFAQYATLRDTYEANHANTFILDADDINDLRPDVMGINSSVWAFKQFKFKATAPIIYNGTITLVSSVFFNYSAYTNAITQSSSYTPAVSSDDSFKLLLDSTTPYQVEYEYISNSIFSNIGQSVRHIKDKGGLRKKWKLSWITSEAGFLELQMFYRKKAGIMGTFGIPEEGSTGINEEYVASGYYEELTKAHFMRDSLKFTKRVDNMYICSTDIIEAL